ALREEERARVRAEDEDRERERGEALEGAEDRPRAARKRLAPRRPEDARDDEQDPERGEVPEVRGPRGSGDEAEERRRAPAPPQGFVAPLDPAVGEDERRDEEREREQVRMKVRVEEREERKLVDGLEILGTDHARRVPVVEVGREGSVPGVDGADDVAGE